MSNPWFRLYKEFATDPVVQSLAFEDQRHYIVILCMKCDGVLDRKISKQSLNRIIYRTLGLDPVSGEEAKKRLEEVALIDKNWSPRTWNKRQFLSDHSTERSRKYRKNKETGNGIATKTQRHCNGPDTDTDTEKKNSKKKATKNGKNGQFKPPTIAEVQARIDEMEYAVSAQRFHSFYESKGWMVGRNKMKSWHSALAGWEARDQNKNTADDFSEYTRGNYL